MNAKVGELRILIERLLEKSGETATRKGFRAIVDGLDLQISDRYIYDHLYIATRKFKATDTKTIRESHANSLAKYLGFKNFREFTESIRQTRDLQLDSCLGSYYSYIRMNAKETTLLQSPVRIAYDAGKYILEQKGPRNTFKGEIKSKDGCWFILLESKQSKSFYHIYRLGNIISPELIQGIFSGVSSESQPIGGRVVLIKTKTDFSKLTTARLSPSRSRKNLFAYFDRFEDNNLSIKKSSTFTLSDL